MLETSKGGLDTRSLSMNVHEFDWSKVNNVIYDEDGVVIRTIPAIHLEGSVSFILEWKGMKVAFSGDTLANRWWTEAAKGADLAIHECFLPNEYFVTKYKFQPAEAIYVSTMVHTTAPVFGKIMAMTQPKRAVAYHFQNDPDTLPAVVTAVPGGVRRTGRFRRRRDGVEHHQRGDPNPDRSSQPATLSTAFRDRAAASRAGRREIRNTRMDSAGIRVGNAADDGEGLRRLQREVRH